jgi:3'-5' exoribonuclease
MSESPHPDKGPWVKDFRSGTHFIGFYALRGLNLDSYRDPGRGQYLKTEISDRSGRIAARLWENVEETLQQLGTARIVKLDGEVDSYRDTLQVRVIRMRPAKEDEFELADLILSTSRDIDAMIDSIDILIDNLGDPFLRQLVEFFYNNPQIRAALCNAPAAARIHHSYRGGLLEHIYEITILAKPLLDLYPSINQDMLLTGILLHDIGKLEELSWEDEILYTDQGRLIGHLILGDEAVSKAIDTIPQFPVDLNLQVKHMILAHHGRYEYGSPRRPKTLEAIALHHLENLDAQVNRFEQLIEDARNHNRDWTTYDHRLGRSLYAQGDDDLSIEEQGLID